jgi:hypothetical protein
VTDLSDDFNYAGAEFLKVDLQVANTFMDFAAGSSNAETVDRNHQNARVAYDTILRFVSTLKLSVADHVQIEDGLAALKLRLLAVGQQF